MVTTIKKTTKRKEVKRLLDNIKPAKSDKVFNASKFCGKIRFDEDALTIQKRLRNEWK
jgi:hypothetical protein